MLSILQEDWDDITVTQRRDRLLDLERGCQDVIAEDKSTEFEASTVHHHCNGVYAREITIPKDTLLVGEIHLTSQINVVSKGKIVVVTEQGKQIISAPHTFISPAGTKRAGYTLEDTVWTVFHATTSTDQQDIKEQFIAPSYEELDNKLGNVNELDSNRNSRCRSSGNGLEQQQQEEGS